VLHLAPLYVLCFDRCKPHPPILVTKHKYLIILRDKEPSSSVSIVSDCGLEDRAIGVRSPAGANDFSSNLCVQTGSEVHPASCTLGTGGAFPGTKHGRGVTLTSHPHLVPRSRMSRSYTSCPPKPHYGMYRDCFAFIQGEKLLKGRNFLIH
jgi:hypothetical protein